VNGVCQACADNCNACDLLGAGFCDSAQCGYGFVNTLDGNTCNACLNGCAVCDSVDLSICN
jgi:hypothetical protein